MRMFRIIFGAKVALALLGVGVLLSGCLDKRHPGLTYMPDMAYSRAYEAYDTNNLKSKDIS